MLKTQHSPIPPGSEKHHYHILDGLRGVAAIVVVWFHIFEAYATSHVDQIINHGYLAVDFFFMLSGFVIGYAYDNRWKTMTTGEFIKRRLIRLQPMVAIGAIIGALIFYLFPGLPRMGCIAGSGHLPVRRYLRQYSAHSVSSRHGNPGSGRNVPAQRPELVPVL